MVNMKRVKGLFNAPMDKRYKSFCVQAADCEEVWLMQETPDVPVFQQDRICVWPGKEFVVLYQADAIPVVIEVHDFMDECRNRIKNQDFIIHVFPNTNDCCAVLASRLLVSIQAELNLVE